MSCCECSRITCNSRTLRFTFTQQQHHSSETSQSPVQFTLMLSRKYLFPAIKKTEPCYYFFLFCQETNRHRLNYKSRLLGATHRNAKTTPARKINTRPFLDCKHWRPTKNQHIHSSGIQNSSASRTDTLIFFPPPIWLLLQQTWPYLKKLLFFLNCLASPKETSQPCNMSSPSQNRKAPFFFIWTLEPSSAQLTASSNRPPGVWAAAPPTLAQEDCPLVDAPEGTGATSNLAGSHSPPEISYRYKVKCWIYKGKSYTEVN